MADASEVEAYAGSVSLEQNGAHREASFTLLQARIECRTKDFDSRITKNFIIA